jgi:hypothetical protein
MVWIESIKMSDPGVGTIVIYHDQIGSNLVDMPAIVSVTHDSWISGLGITQPSAGTVVISELSTNLSSWNSVGAISQGTTPGTYSLIEMQSADN